MKISNDCVVAIHYTLTDDNGATLDSSSGGEPLQYLHGARGLIPGLEQQLEGREAGHEFTASIQPEDAYGVQDAQLVQEVPLQALAEIENLTVGMQLQSRAPDGNVQMLVVEAIGEESATLNANHPLAGQVLHFEVSVASVREASEEEVEHGHPH